MKRKSIVSMIVCIVFTLSLLSNLAYAVPAAAETTETETAVSVQQQEPLNETSETQQQEEQQESSETAQQNMEEEVTETTSEEISDASSQSTNSTNNSEITGKNPHIIIEDITQATLNELSQNNTPDENSNGTTSTEVTDFSAAISWLENAAKEGLISQEEADTRIKMYRNYQLSLNNQNSRASTASTFSLRSSNRSLLSSAAQTYNIPGFTNGRYKYVPLDDIMYTREQVLVPGYVTVMSIQDPNPNGYETHSMRDTYDSNLSRTNHTNLEAAIHADDCANYYCSGPLFTLNIKYLKSIKSDGTLVWATVTGYGSCAHQSYSFPPKNVEMKADLIPIFMGEQYPDGGSYYSITLTTVIDVNLTLGYGQKYQGVVGINTALDVPYTYLKLKKTSSNPAITDGNSNYSFLDTEYRVYKDANCTNDVGGLYLDENGDSNTVHVFPGTYYIKEKVPGKNYKLDPTVYSIEVTDGNTIANPAMINVQDEPNLGYAKLKKSSQNPALTNGNSAYSLAGAEYGVFSEQACITRVGTFTTDANGDTTAIELPPSTYYVKELTAPYGFALDDTVHTVTVTPGQTATLNVTDIPQLDPVAVFLGKIDRETNLNRPSGSASLAGAEFTVKYYPALVNDVTGLTPQYTWVITTNENGVAFIPDNQLPYVTYPDGSTRHGLPIGTLSIQETKAPAGYLINDNVFIRQITSNGNSAIVDTYNQPEIPEQVIRGGFTMQKADKDRIETDTAADNSLPQGNGVFTNATFEVVNQSGQSVRVNGTDYANNAVCYTFTTDANGRFTSANNLLPYGNYLLREKTPSSGYLVAGGWTATVNIRTNGTIVTANSLTNNPVPEQIIRGGFKLQKSDSETNLTTPQGSAAFQGANFEIISMSAQAVYTQMDGVWGWRAPNTVCYKISADENGAAQSPVDALPFGSYRAKEVAPAPTGYLVNTTWQRDFQITQNGVIHDLSNTPVPNQVIRGDISLVKFKEDDGEVKTPLADVEFTLTHEKTGEKVVIVTDAQGYASTTNHALVYGKWLVEESKTPFGFNSIQPFTVDVSENHRIYYYIIENQTIRSAIRLVKVDAATGNTIPIANAEFQIRNVNTGNIVEFTTYYPNVQKLTVLKTGDDGTCVLPQMLEAGTYEAIELKAPVSYLLSNQPIQFEVTGGGDFTSPVEVKIPNTPVMGRIQINKTGDIYIGYAEEQHPILGTVYKPQFETGKLIGVVFDVIAANDIVTGDGTIRAKQGDIVDTVTTTAGEDRTKDLFLGTYIVRERQPLDGYIAAATDYTVTLEYKDDVTPIVTAQADIHNEWLPSKVSLEKEAEQWKVVQNDDKVYTEITVSPGKGFLFALFAAEDIQDIKADMPVAYGETDDNGKLIFEGKYLHGQYYLKEIYTNTAYHPDDTKYPVDLTYTAGTTMLEVQHKATNRYKTIEVTIDKKEITGDNPVPGATIEIYDSNGQVVYRDVTDKDGQLKDIKLIPGKYTFKEILAPDFYALNVAVFEFEIKEDGSIIGDTLIRDDFTRIQFKKVGIGGVPLPGAKFGLYTVDAVEKVNLGVNNVQNIMSGNSENVITQEQYAENILGELIAEAVSDENGIVTFEKIPHKEYIVKELEAPEGFQLSDETYSFKIDGTYVNPDAPVKEFVNNKLVTITKTDLTNDEPVPGATVEIYDSEGNVIYEAVTDENGQIPDIPMYAPGKYTFKETLSPEFYALNPKTFEFEITETGEVKGDLTFEDDISRVPVLKVDKDTREPIVGAKFGFFNKDGELLQEAVTDSNGLVSFDGNGFGEYFIKELEAAPGYKITDKTITVIINNQWENPEPIDFDNAKLIIGKIPDSPKTGDRTNKGIYMALMALSAVSVMGIYVMKKKRLNESRDE